MAARVDASGVAVELPRPPRRIVSLVPSTTEILCALGLGEALV
ncbi:MAG TPA: ABC transporter substrate-binding protein, partial [Candidatus Binatia bacterium]|nr:ABC transporter substrate-binding protein [Candidatus Binatia bacterium]